jgi:hypothetical protein
MHGLLNNYLMKFSNQIKEGKSGFLWGNLKGRGQLQDITIDCRILLKWMLTGLIWLTIGTNGGLL